MLNRALFLLSLQSRRPDVYWHNDAPPEWSFDDELTAIRSNWPKVVEYASGLMLDHYFEAEIGFMEET